MIHEGKPRSDAEEAMKNTIDLLSWKAGLYEPDAVNHPSHYQSRKGIEAMDSIEAAIEDLTGMEAFCTGNAIKYLARWKKKGGHEDLRKARFYINKLLGDE